ncbi:MAG: hypothetical protein L0323_10880, partial [Planctomycetes bacterium]|nr:hypothetical protein [Planctomycetota bacterium]
SRNRIQGQVFASMLNYLSSTPALNYAGTGVLISAENGAAIDSSVVFDSNEVSGNQGRGFLVATRTPVFGGPSPVSLAPRLQNERIWSNGTVAAAGQEGVLIYDGALGGSGGAVAPLFVLLDVWGHPGFGVNNAFTTSAPQLWNSNVWGNNAGNGDLNNFGFSNTLPVGGRVAFSNFCGGPFQLLVPAVICGTQPTAIPGAAGSDGCISSNPYFANPAAGDFELTCAPAGSCANAQLIGDCSQSEAVDAAALAGTSVGDQAAGTQITLASIPGLDALGRPRPIQVLCSAPQVLPDMGALEKQTTTP